MKNKTKFIFANLYALVSVVLILAAFKFLEIEIGLNSEAMLPNLILVTVPQAGFIYVYLMSFVFDNSEVMA